MELYENNRFTTGGFNYHMETIGPACIDATVLWNIGFNGDRSGAGEADGYGTISCDGNVRIDSGYSNCTSLALSLTSPADSEYSIFSSYRASGEGDDRCCGRDEHSYSYNTEGLR